jgi:Predicted hydrolase (HAD superfamily)
MKLATFDIFDTTLLRKCGSPEVVQPIVAHRLFPTDRCRREAFLAWRLTANGNAITSIYASAEEAGFDSYSTDSLMQAELNVEAEMLTANPMVQAKIKDYRKQGYVIKFVSDMYLPSDFLKRILIREQCALLDDEVIVSCEWEARKDNGSLYQRVRAAYHPKEWIHHGDNRWSDVTMARKNGVKAFLIDTQYTAIEQRILEAAQNLRDGWQLTWLVGISRTARLQQKNTPEAVFAADYIVPTYLPFVIDAIEEAKQQHIDCLQFLSRDGYIMLEMAKALAPTEVKLNYLFASRQSLRLAYLKNGNAETYLKIVDKHSLLSKNISDLLWQLQTTPKEMREKFGIEFSYRKIKNEVEEQDFLNKIFHHPQFTPYFKNKCKKACDLTIDYFRQEKIIGDTQHSMMVDVGWLGTSRLMLNHILKEHSYPEVPTYYLGVRADVLPRSNGDYIPYFRIGQLDTMATAVIEAYFSASPYPTTVGYHKEHTHIVPTFPDGKTYQENDVVRTNRETAINMAQMVKEIGTIDSHILYLWAKISIDSLAQLKDKVNLSPLTKVDASDIFVSLVKRLSLIELLNVIFLAGRVSGFDRGSLYYTLGNRFYRLVIPIHNLTSRCRSYIYRKLMR